MSDHPQLDYLRTADRDKAAQFLAALLDRERAIGIREAVRAGEARAMVRADELQTAAFKVLVARR